MKKSRDNPHTWSPRLLALLAVAATGGACDPGAGAIQDDDNPFLEDVGDSGKEDSGWITAVNAPEVELVLESDIECPGRWQAMMGPTDLSQFALTYLRKHAKVFIESQLVVPEQERKVEWLLDGSWVNAEDVDYYNVPLERLNHFRVTGVNAVVYKPEEPLALVGNVYTATVPTHPYFVSSRAGEACANNGSHALFDEDYWYFWDPDRSDCEIETYTMTATVTDMVDSSGPRFPEYDRLVEDGRVDALVFFGAFGGTSVIEDDKGYRSMLSFVRKMLDAGFVESTSPAGLSRFSRTQNGIEYIVDVSGPADFEGLGDFEHVGVFDEGVRSHEIVVYNGHSILGTSDYWQREGIYSDGYQIFFFNGCLGYEYYVRAILDGKGSWDDTDVISNIMETPSAPQPKVIAAFLAATFQGAAEAGRVSYREILGAINRRTYNSCYGISGARTNCFSPDGSLCEEPEPETRRYTNDTAEQIPDNDPVGITSRIEVSDSQVVSGLDIEIDIEHSWLGDLLITLEHGGTTVALWDRVDDYYGSRLDETFQTDAFGGMDASGTWTLTVSDRQAVDTGTLHRWSLVVSPQ